MKNTSLIGETSLEIVVVGEQSAYGGDWEMKALKLYGAHLPGAGEYSHEVVLSESDSSSLWELLPNNVQDHLLTLCSENAEPVDDE